MDSSNSMFNFSAAFLTCSVGFITASITLFTLSIASEALVSLSVKATVAAIKSLNLIPDDWAISEASLIFLENSSIDDLLFWMDIVKISITSAVLNPSFLYFSNTLAMALAESGIGCMVALANLFAAFNCSITVVASLAPDSIILNAALTWSVIVPPNLLKADSIPFCKAVKSISFALSFSSFNLVLNSSAYLVVTSTEKPNLSKRLLIANASWATSDPLAKVSADISFNLVYLSLRASILLFSTSYDSCFSFAAALVASVSAFVFAIILFK